MCLCAMYRHDIWVCLTTNSFYFFSDLSYSWDIKSPARNTHKNKQTYIMYLLIYLLTHSTQHLYGDITPPFSQWSPLKLAGLSFITPFMDRLCQGRKKQLLLPMQMCPAGDAGPLAGCLLASLFLASSVLVFCCYIDCPVHHSDGLLSTRTSGSTSQR